MRGLVPKWTLVLGALHPRLAIASNSSLGSEGRRRADQAAGGGQGGAEKVGAPGSAGPGSRQAGGGRGLAPAGGLGARGRGPGGAGQRTSSEA